VTLEAAAVLATPVSRFAGDLAGRACRSPGRHCGSERKSTRSEVLYVGGDSRLEVLPPQASGLSGEYYKNLRYCQLSWIIDSIDENDDRLDIAVEDDGRLDVASLQALVQELEAIRAQVPEASHTSARDAAYALCVRMALFDEDGRVWTRPGSQHLQCAMTRLVNEWFARRCGLTTLPTQEEAAEVARTFKGTYGVKVRVVGETQRREAISKFYKREFSMF
jgi:hypothetical protein